MPDATSTSAAAISVSAMARQVGLSRARFYDLIQDGFFVAPVCLIGNKRSVYFASMVERNMLAKQTGIGCNGEIRVFNVASSSSTSDESSRGTTTPRTRRRRRVSTNSSQSNDADGLVQRLVHAQRQLGLTDVTTERVSQAVALVCPDGTADIAEADLIRAVYRRLRGSNDA